MLVVCEIKKRSESYTVLVLYSHITNFRRSFMHEIKTNFDKFYSIVSKILKNNITKDGSFKRVGRKPKFSDIEVISFLSLVGHLVSILRITCLEN